MSTEQTNRAEGGCLCGAVRYEVRGSLRKVVYCHCEQCRRTTGHFVAATACHEDHLKVTDQGTLKWYVSSDIARRAFCDRCGSSLFWKPTDDDYIAVFAGTLDVPSGLSSQEHIYVDDKSDYYDIADGLPTFPQDHPGLWVDEDA